MSDMPAEIWVEHHDDLNADGVWFEEYRGRIGPDHRVRYTRPGAYARTVGADGMPEAGKHCLVWAQPCLPTIAVSDPGWIRNDGTGNAVGMWASPTDAEAVSEANDTDRWCYVEDVVRVMFPSEDQTPPQPDTSD